jgi:hypothetical protein
MGPERADVVRLVGVYDADGSWRGELSYVVRKRLGRASCALCDLTHGAVRERADWRACRSRLPVPMTTYHRDDQPEALRSSLGVTAPPFVAGELDDGRYVVLVDGTALAACAGEPERLVDAVTSALARRHW